jgi:hypothetical protein
LAGAQKATQEVLGHSDANLTANIYTEMPSDAIRAELTKLPWITENSPETGEKDCAPNCAPLFGARGQTVSERGNSASDRDASKYVDSPLKRRMLAALDTLRQNLEMVDATGPTPLATIAEQNPAGSRSISSFAPRPLDLGISDVNQERSGLIAGRGEEQEQQRGCPHSQTHFKIGVRST